MPVSKNNALVTGASSGIGLCISETLAEMGFNIIAVGNQEEKLNNLKIKLENTFKINVFTFLIDLSEEDSALRVYNYCHKNGLVVEVLINNAGTLLFSETPRADYADIKGIMNLHMMTPALLCRLFGEQMIKCRKGYIMNVSSISAVMPYPGISLYGPTKAFLRNFTRAIRTEMDRYGVCVSCLIPGPTLTALYDPGKYDTAFARKIGLFKRPDTVARKGIKALFRNRAECVPGVLNKIIIATLPLIPRFIIREIHRRTAFV